MCESNAYLIIGEKEELLLKDVVLLKPSENGELYLENLAGEEKRVKGKVLEINFLEHKIRITVMG